MVGGLTGPSTVETESESWDGSSWTEIADLNAAKGYVASDGTQTAAWVATGTIGPEYIAVHEQWNGTSWTELADLNAVRAFAAGFGTVTAALVASSFPSANNTETWNGTAWTEVGNLNTGRHNLAGCGIQTEGIVFGGLTDPGQVDETEQWYGSAWTEVADLPAATSRTSGMGTQSLALQATGGEPASTATSEWTIAQNIKTITD